MIQCSDHGDRDSALAQADNGRLGLGKTPGLPQLVMMILHTVQGYRDRLDSDLPDPGYEGFRHLESVRNDRCTNPFDDQAFSDQVPVTSHEDFPADQGDSLATQIRQLISEVKAFLPRQLVRPGFPSARTAMLAGKAACQRDFPYTVSERVHCFPSVYCCFAFTALPAPLVRCTRRNPVKRYRGQNLKLFGAA